MCNYTELRGHLLGDLEIYLESIGVPPTPLEEPLWSDNSVQLARCKSLACSFYKKLQPRGNSRSADEAALKKFKAVNHRMLDYRGFVAHTEAESVFWDYLKDNFNRGLDYVWDDDGNLSGFDLGVIRDHMDIGPGAAQLSDSRHLVTKLFCGEISYATSDYLITLYRSALSETGLFAEAEFLRNREYGFVRVEGGKIFFAKKNAEISRTCCTEPNLNMLIQKAVQWFFEDRLARSFGISLSTQPDFNKDLARKGSIDGTFGTADLVSASDSFSLRLFDDLKRPDFLKSVMLMFRCERAVLPDGSQVELGMVSTMGNGFTFPLQTYLFACVVRSVYQMMGLPSSDPSKHYGVFGDDIIVKAEAFDFVCQMLHKLGFEVNAGKSFNTGFFRESCGGDYYHGYDIRGVYVKDCSSPQQVCSLINRLNRWSARTGIPLPSVISYLWKLKGLKPLIPPDNPDDAGIHVPFALSAPRVDDDYRFVYKSYIVSPRKFWLCEPDDEKNCPNPPGFGIGFLSGHTRRPDVVYDESGRSFYSNGVDVSIRESPDAPVRYKIRRRTTHYWDYPNACYRRDPVSHEAWKAYMAANLA